MSLDAKHHLANLLQQRSRFEGVRVFAVVEYRNNEPLILNFHTTPDCKNLKEEIDNPSTNTLRNLIRNPDRRSEIILGEYTPEQGIIKLEELIGTEYENEFIAMDGSLHIIAPCLICCEEGYIPSS